MKGSVVIVLPVARLNIAFRMSEDKEGLLIRHLMTSNLTVGLLDLFTHHPFRRSDFNKANPYYHRFEASDSIVVERVYFFPIGIEQREKREGERS
jgi:hypothetical protein